MMAEAIKVRCWNCGRVLKSTKGGRFPRHNIPRGYSNQKHMRLKKCPAGGSIAFLRDKSGLNDG